MNIEPSHFSYIIKINQFLINYENFNYIINTSKSNNKKIKINKIFKIKNILKNSSNFKLKLIILILCASNF